MKLYCLSRAIVIAKHTIKYQCLFRESWQTRNDKVVVNLGCVLILWILFMLRLSYVIVTFRHTDIIVTPILTHCGL